jgi:DNA-binding LytR/AlgR family response regulator
MIKCIVIDDEKLAQDALVSHLKKIHDLEVLGTFNNALDAKTLITSEKLDLIFCDIQMPDAGGVTFLKSLKKPPLFIFVTENPNYAIESFELDVLAYILKPFREDRLLKSINKARVLLDAEKIHSNDRKSLIFKDRYSNIIMPYDEIFFIKSDKDYIKISTIEKEYTIWRKISDVEKALDSARQFLRVQKSYIVNLDFAKMVRGSLIKMKGNIEDIPIGRQYKAELYKRLGISVEHKLRNDVEQD